MFQPVCRKVVSRFDWGADSIVLLHLYIALVRSKLDYGSIVYGSAHKSYIGMLDTVHHQGIRLSLGAFRTSPVESLYVEANEESLYRRRERLSLQYAIKLSSTPNNPTFDTVFRPKYSEIFAIRPNAIPTFGLRIKDLIDEANINIETIRQATIPESPPWQLESPLIIYGLKTVKKVDTNPWYSKDFSTTSKINILTISFYILMVRRMITRSDVLLFQILI